ncbi:MAG TPA: hypothetical protein VNK95_21030, partial [Caldilineaceae bacterium]|nr:hypothetical protein [Caldilineaceae bacterium]
GLAGLLATASYANWRRQIRRTIQTRQHPLTPQGWRAAWAAPGTRFALSVSLTFIAAGAAWRGLLDEERIRWQVIAWGLLFFLLFIQTVLAARAGHKSGWALSPEGNSRHERAES